MARVKGGVHAKKKHKAVLKRAKGHYGNRSRTFRAANESVMHACSTRSATGAPARARCAGCGSSASTRPAGRTAPPTAGSSPG